MVEIHQKQANIIKNKKRSKICIKQTIFDILKTFVTDFNILLIYFDRLNKHFFQKQININRK